LIWARREGREERMWRKKGVWDRGEGGRWLRSSRDLRIQGNERKDQIERCVLQTR
jgi:hypothetical protein